MILNSKIDEMVITSEKALDYYNYNAIKDILSLEIINASILKLETKYEQTNGEDVEVIQHCVVDIPQQNYGEITFYIVTKDETDTQVIHIQKLTNEDLLISVQEKLIIKNYVENWYKQNV